jgi:pilus retraction protein PilT
MIVDDWIEQAWSLGASDLHLEAGTPLVARVRGDLQTVGGAVTGDILVQAAQEFLGAEGWAEFRERGSADMSVAIGGVRCRVNFYRTVRGVAAAIRLLAPSIKDLHGCNLHPDFRKLIDATTGLIIISGPTGSGKSTTLAALIEEINVTRSRNIVTLESPLEYIYTNRRSFIRQREIPTHSPSFEQGIIDALRENPDVLVVSEMRTPEVMRLTLNAAETGHLVLATMHSATCGEALSRCRYAGKYLDVYQFPDGRIEIRAAGVSVPYSTYDKLGAIDQGAIVENKRLGHALRISGLVQSERDDHSYAGPSTAHRIGESKVPRNTRTGKKTQRELNQKDLQKAIEVQS